MSLVYMDNSKLDLVLWEDFTELVKVSVGPCWATSTTEHLGSPECFITAWVQLWYHILLIHMKCKLEEDLLLSRCCLTSSSVRSWSISNNQEMDSEMDWWKPGKYMEDGGHSTQMSVSIGMTCLLLVQEKHEKEKKGNKSWPCASSSRSSTDKLWHFEKSLKTSVPLLFERHYYHFLEFWKFI